MANTPSPHSSEIDYILGIQYGDFDDQINHLFMMILM